MKKWPTYQETGFSLYYVFKMKKSQNVKDFVKIEGRERGQRNESYRMTNNL